MPPKIRLKFNKDGTAPAGQSHNADALGSSAKGVKRDSDRNPKSTEPSGQVNKPNAPLQKPDSFYGASKKQKLGGSGFKPTNKLKEKPQVSRQNTSRAAGLKAKPALKTNTGAPRFEPHGSNPSPNPNLKAEGCIDDADNVRRNDKSTAKPGLETNSSNASVSKHETHNSKPASMPSPSSQARNHTDKAVDGKPTEKPGPKINSSKTGTAKLDTSESASKPSPTPSNVGKSESDLISSKHVPNRGLSPDRAKLYDSKRLRLERSRREGLAPRKLRAERLKGQLLITRRNLPIWLHQTQIRLELRTRDVMLLIGETGSGKSTQVPQFLCNEPWMKPQKFEIGDKTESVGGIIAITQPRRIAATTLAARVASEMGYAMMDLDGKVGYAVRFNSWTPAGMKIKFMTEGMLLKELLVDPHLKKYSAVIVDEIHERSLDADLLTGFLKQIVMGDKKGRHGVPLKVVIMSATANMKTVVDFFGGGQGRRFSDASQTSRISDSTWEGFSNGGSSPEHIKHDDEKEDHGEKEDDEKKENDENGNEENGNTAITNTSNSDSSATLDEQVPVDVTEFKPPQDSTVIIHHVKGRQHPVKLFYAASPLEDSLDGMIQAIYKIHTTKPYPGDILCFLTGQDEIETLKKSVEDLAATLNTKELPFLQAMALYGKMKPDEQQKAFQPLKTRRTRKVVLATNIAETSVTVPGVRYVVDGGKAKIVQFRESLGIESLLAKPISKSSAIQRKGRAGREAEGECYRLYTQQEYSEFPVSDVPEILRTDIVQAVLTMKAKGVENPYTFPLMDPPEPSAITKALDQLLTLGALDEDNSMTDIGNKMAKFPLPPAYARVLISAASEDYDCVFEAIDAIACLTADGDIFKLPSSERQREETQTARNSLDRREGDILTVLNTMQRYLEQFGKTTKRERETWCEQHQVNSQTIHQATLIRMQLQKVCVAQKFISEESRAGIDFEPITEEKAEALLKCFLTAFANKTAYQYPDKSYHTMATRDLIAIHPSSVLYGGKKNEAIMFLQQVFTTKHFAKIVNRVQMVWVEKALMAQKA